MYKKYINYYFKKLNKIYSLGYKSSTGRNFLGTICCFHKFTGLKKNLILIDFYRKINNWGNVIKINKNRNYTALIGGILFENGLYTNILLTENIMLGHKLYIGTYYKKNTNELGLNVCLKFIKLFSLIHNIETFPYSKSILIRAAGGSGLIIKKELNKVIIKLKSGWNLLISKYCIASIGIMSNSKHKFKNLKKAGVSYNLGIRPTVRGVAMNPHDHPHGGGEGKKSPPSGQLSPWAWLTKGTPSLKKKWQLKKKKLYKSL